MGSANASSPGLVRFYTLYERLWHWLQALSAVALLLTGFAIAFPAAFAPLGFASAVAVHHAAAWVLLVNAGLALFYNLASGLIRRYVPSVKDIFPLGMHHARYYVLGIFRGEPHPFERTPEKRLLPLQKVTYFLILNVLLPLMALTGLLKLGADSQPELLGWFGGMPVVAVLHRLGAWLFAAFLILHVYMTTTGSTWWANLRTMLTGYGQAECREEEPK
ncbi:MAG TPA: cytochrome b/b6 domain-containing protein [Myxococcota bacterium]|nr:cytochrome b/b6 domain-containing protein [Myxococcota bacterium]HRY91997.1 cytochrome b/b6 domain-containing protein [Myxococcota bacterium]HSA23948.1 cytochrome b/b6 domain-containing protein [Myxococcota bacterium]